jgi:hypothetical protein
MLIDSEDQKRVGLRKWSVGSNGYLQTTFKDTRVSLHHYLIGRPLLSLEIDHINRNKLDNRKNNLRIVTRTQNAINRGKQSNNRSGKTGVNFHQTGKYSYWRAYIHVKGKQKDLGSFVTKEEAIAARRNYEAKI